MAKIDMTGQRYGLLVALEEAPRPAHIKSRTTFWKFQCDCGNQVILNGSNVRSGNTQSCGCLQKKITSEIRSINLVGQYFGKLKALERISEQGKRTRYLCKCECGNIVSIEGTNLTKGLTKSCGCNKFASYGVQNIEKILKENQIPYTREVSIKINGKTYFIDFVIKFNNVTYFLEYDGKQHFQFHNIACGWDTKENLEKTHRRDLEKNKYCFLNNIPLIRIPYDLKEITLESILLDKTSWQLTKDNEKEYYTQRMNSEEIE